MVCKQSRYVPSSAVVLGLLAMLYLYGSILLPGSEGGKHPLNMRVEETEATSDSLNKSTDLMSTSGNCSPMSWTLKDVRTIHADRRKHFKAMCKTLTKENNEENEFKMVYLRGINVAAALVPKVGSTFMLNAFSYLISGKTSGFQRPRMLVHVNKLNSPRFSFTTRAIPAVPTMIFTRNPYSRLFSAFLDKIYILNNIYLAGEVVKYVNFHYHRNVRCPLDLEFRDFLLYALHSDKNIIYNHYQPTSSLISLPVICAAKQLTIVKQETFTTDIEYWLTDLAIEQERKETLQNILRCNTNDTVKGIIETVFFKYQQLTQMRCISSQVLVQRLWESFKIQGYIQESSNPEHTQLATEKSFLKLAMNEMKQNPVSSAQAASQRQKAIIEAYSDIDNDILQEIIRQYRDDFTWFQYDPTSLF